MPRPRKYASPAEKNRAYRMRKKLQENEHPPELDQVAKAIDRLYKQRVAADVGGLEQMIGKTPYETLLRVVVYELLFKQHLKDNAWYELPPLETLIRPAIGISPHLASWIISPGKIADEARAYVFDEDSDELDEDDEKKNSCCR
jgi:hypothetical protein